MALVISLSLSKMLFGCCTISFVRLRYNAVNLQQALKKWGQSKELASSSIPCYKWIINHTLSLQASMLPYFPDARVCY